MAARCPGERKRTQAKVKSTVSFPVSAGLRHGEFDCEFDFDRAEFAPGQDASSPALQLRLSVLWSSESTLDVNLIDTMSVLRAIYAR